MADLPREQVRPEAVEELGEVGVGEREARQLRRRHVSTAQLTVGGAHRVPAVARECARLRPHVGAVGAVDEGEDEVEPDEDQDPLDGKGW